MHASIRLMRAASTACSKSYMSITTGVTGSSLAAAHRRCAHHFGILCYVTQDTCELQMIASLTCAVLS